MRDSTKKLYVVMVATPDELIRKPDMAYIRYDDAADRQRKLNKSGKLRRGDSAGIYVVELKE